MRAPATRRFRFAAALLALSVGAACARGGGAAAPGSTASAPGATPAGACAMPGGWSFDDACATGRIGKGGGTLAMQGTDGLRVLLTFGPNLSDADGLFIAGAAENEAHISGLLNGQLAFPGYGRVPCQSSDPQSAPACLGRAFLYLLLLNTASDAARFAASPRIEIDSAGRFRTAAECGVQTLAWRDEAAMQAIWLTHPLNVAPQSADRLVIPPVDREERFVGAGAFTVLAIVCYERSG